MMRLFLHWAAAGLALAALSGQCEGARVVVDDRSTPSITATPWRALWRPTGSTAGRVGPLAGVRSGAEAWWDAEGLDDFAELLSLGASSGSGAAVPQPAASPAAASRAPPPLDNAGPAAGPVPPHKPLLPLDASDGLLFGLIAATLALAAGGGIGGGAIYMPLLVAVGRFAPGRAVALSNLTILGGAAANLVLNVQRGHPRMPGRPLIDWTLILVGRGGHGVGRGGREVGRGAGAGRGASWRMGRGGRREEGLPTDLSLGRVFCGGRRRLRLRPPSVGSSLYAQSERSRGPGPAGRHRCPPGPPR
jgi:hypothetical protein